MLRFDTCLKVFDAHCHGSIFVKLEVDVASDFIVMSIFKRVSLTQVARGVDPLPRQWQALLSIRPGRSQQIKGEKKIAKMAKFFKIQTIFDCFSSNERNVIIPFLVIYDM